MKNKIILNNRIKKNLTGFISLLNRVDEYFAYHIRKEPVLMCEIGCFIGESTSLISDYFPNVKLYAIDMWKNDFDPDDPICQFDFKVAEEMFDANIKFNNNVIKKKMSSFQFSKQILNGSIDFIYIDAAHSYSESLEDFKLFYPKVRKGGIFAGHDYINNEFCGVKTAILDFMKNREPYSTFEDNSWMYIKEE